MLTNKDQKIKIEITNNAGKKIASGEKNLVTGVNHINYNSGAWGKGMYIVRVFLEDGNTKVVKFVK